MFIHDHSVEAIGIHLIDEEGFDAWRAAQPGATHTWLTTCLFRPERNKVALIPDGDGKLQSVVVGLGKASIASEAMFWNAAGLPERLPDGRFYVVNPLNDATTQFAQGWAYGRYRFDRYRKPSNEKAQLLELPRTVELGEIERINAGCSLARDLVNTPASDMSPADLANAAVTVAQKFNATNRVYVGDELLTDKFPAVHAVGRASHVAPRLIDIQWGNPSHPKVSLIGKGVCFDSGGLDLKPSASMLLMKKDMGGAASVLGLAHAIMDAALPVRLRVVIPAVENSVAGNAFRPGDVLQTRRGLTVEVGNTDAEGRLVLADALTLADAEQPELLIDLATLTGAARVALGPELPALFAADEKFANDVVQIAVAQSDPLWRLPLWSGYEDEFSSKLADINNISSSGFSGAIIGALFLKRFVTQAKCWAHIDMYAWNGKERPGRPVGAEPQCIRALYAYLKQRYAR
ncbi:MAG TPA: leucyl aminopeptidase family protein [Steroidobacteraceae bacterium]|nr:leucyl aminopeptidase family protein [Steroidobacteraceae bacterium]